MDYYYFIILSIELAFCLIQLLMAAFSRRQMNKLEDKVRRQRDTNVDAASKK